MRENRTVTTPASPNPQAIVEPLIGHRVKLTLTNGHTREGAVLGCGSSGFQITSGIGGRMLFYYGEVDAIDDLGTEEKPVCTCPDIDVSRWPGEVSLVKGLDLHCRLHGRSA